MTLLHWLADRKGFDLVEKGRSRHQSIKQHVAEVLAFYGVNCVIDVGANAGQYAEKLRKRGYRGRIVSFEPVSETFESLKRRSQGDPEWIVHRMALGRTDGVMSMNVTGCSRLASFLSPSEFGRRHRGEEASVLRTQEVPVRRLDGLFGEIVRGVSGPRVFLKMDTQGFDLEVFAGAEGCVDALVGLQSELSVIPLYGEMPAYQDALAEYRKWGFEPTGFYEVARDSDSLALIEVDCVMIRPKSDRPRPVRTGLER